MPAYFSKGQHSHWSDYEKYLQRRCDRRTFRDWLIQCRDEDPETVLTAFADILGEVFQFLALGMETPAGLKSHSLEQRAWVLLYAIRPDLINGESSVDAAERMGVTPAALRQKLMELRSRIPALKIDTDSRRGHSNDKEGERQRRGDAVRRRHAELRKLRQAA
jgi:hypothetical protein